MKLFAESAERPSASKKRCTIYGASGFLGRNLVELLHDKYDLVTPSRMEANVESVFPVISNVDVVINLVNAENNLQVFQNITHYYDGKLITIGSGAEYDHLLPIKNVKEDFDRKPFDAYGLGKYYVSKQAEIRKNVIVLRPFGVFGKYEDFNRRFISKAIIDKMCEKPIVIYQDCKFSYVWVNDLVKIIDYFIEHDANHKFYNVGGHQITLKNIAKQIGPYKVFQGGNAPEYTCDDSRVCEETGIKYTPFKEALKSLKEYYEIIEYNIL